MKTFGQILKEKREAKGWSINKTAIKLGVNPASVFKWEKDEHDPRLLQACDIADLFECSLDELCGRVQV
jgi:transcriptional regulator with XRE-family HTH domain